MFFYIHNSVNIAIYTDHSKIYVKEINIILIKRHEMNKRNNEAKQTLISCFSDNY